MKYWSKIASIFSNLEVTHQVKRYIFSIRQMEDGWKRILHHRLGTELNPCSPDLGKALMGLDFVKGQIQGEWR